MRLTSTGLGIGTSSPSTKLTVRGVTFTDNGASGGASGLVYALSASSGGNFGQLGNTGTRWSLGYGPSLTALGTEVLVWNSSGNVGIGTSSPASQLTVGDATANPAATVSFFKGTASEYRLKLTSSGFNTDGAWLGLGFGYSDNYMKAAIIAEAKDANGRANFHFALNDAASSANAGLSDSKMVLTYSGNVGIGNNNPQSKLHIQSTVGTAETLITLQTAWNSPSGNKSIVWSDGSGALGAIAVNYTSPQGAMTFGSLYNSGYNTTDLMTLTPSGLSIAGALNTTAAITTTSQSGFILDYNTGNRVKSFTASQSSPKDYLTILSAGSTGSWQGATRFGVSYNGGTVLYPLELIANTDGSTAAVAVTGTLSATGNVGIGTTSPTVAQLVIKGDGATGQIRLQAMTNTNQGLSFSYNYSSQFGQINCDEAGVNQLDLWYTALSHKFGRNTSAANMTLDASGNLYVGGTTQIAGSKLNVRGDGAYIGIGGSTVQLLFGDNGGTDGFLGTFTNHALTIRTNNVERARITSGGVLDIGTGAGAVGQIQFPATQVASANANTLDDYEEGTWTPQITDATNNATMGASNSGTYTKIGRVVTCQMYVQVTSLGSVASSIYITGWPFTIGNNGGGSLSDASGLNITAGQVLTLRPWSGDLMRFYIWDATTGTSPLIASQWTASGAAFISATYTV
jgi:hypothetical protein